MCEDVKHVSMLWNEWKIVNKCFLITDYQVWIMIDGLSSVDYDRWIRLFNDAIDAISVHYEQNDYLKG